MLNEKKNFSIDEVEKERDYLEKKKGYRLNGFDGERYYFESYEGPLEYDIHFSIEPMDETVFAEYGYNLVTVYKGTRGGYYYYLVRDESHADRFTDYRDRIEAIALLKNRISRFTLTVLVGLLALFTYLFIKNKNIVYLIVLLPGVFLLVYTMLLKRKYDNFTKTHQNIS